MQGKSIAHQYTLLCVLAFAACTTHRVPQLVDTLDSPPEQTGYLWKPDLRITAPIVVVASVLENRVVISNKPASRLPQIKLDLHEVHCLLENSLRSSSGAIPNEFTFYYFGTHDDRDWNPHYKRMFKASPGRRYIFFLNVEQGVFRSVGDVGEYSLLVSSGTHADVAPPQKRGPTGQITPPTDEELGRLIADILLRKGNGLDLAAFADSLEASTFVSNGWGSRPYNVRLLRTLTREAEPIRQAACQVLSRRFNSQYDCLLKLKEDSNETAEVKAWAEGALKQAAKSDSALLSNLQDPAHIEFLNIELPDSRIRVFEELETLLDSPNEAVRRGACIALRRYYPNEAVSCKQ